MSWRDYFDSTGKHIGYSIPGIGEPELPGCIQNLLGSLILLVMVVIVLGFGVHFLERKFEPVFAPVDRVLVQPFRDLKLRLTNDDVITTKDMANAATITQEEVQEWTARYPAFANVDSVEVREQILLLKRHPGWKPTETPEVKAYDWRTGTYEYIFEDEQGKTVSVPCRREQ